MRTYKDMPLLEATDAYLFWKSNELKSISVASYKRVLNHFCIGLQNKKLGEVYWQDVSTYLHMLKQAGYKQNTLIPIVIAIRNLLEFYHKQDNAIMDPAMIPVPHKEYNMPRVLEDSIYFKLLESIPINNDARHIRNQAIIRMLHDTGARCGEIVSLDIGDIQKCKATIKTEKNRGTRPFREIYWSEETQVYLDRWMLKRAKLYKSNPQKYSDKSIFWSVTGNKAGTRFTIKGLGEMLRRYSAKLDIGVNINAHSFRHKVGRDIIKNGGSASDVMNILGHATLESSTIYTQMYGLEVEDRYRKVLKR